MAARRALALAAAALPLLSRGRAAGNVSVPVVEIAPGVRMPALSIGAGGLESQAADAIVTAWLGLGGRGIDDAWIYRNQDAVRQAIARSGVPREALFITSKIPGCLDAERYIKEDLQQLGLDYIDLLLIHFPRPATACVEAWKVLEDYHARGVLKAIGVSNFKVPDLEAVLGMAKVVPAVNQVRHNVLEHDDETLALCAKHNITVEAYSPLGRGGHSGDISGNAVIKAIAARHGVSAYQVALRWILQHGHILTFQSSSAAHQASDADIFGFSLSDEDMSALDRLQNSTAAPSLQAVFV